MAGVGMAVSDWVSRARFGVSPSTGPPDMLTTTATQETVGALCADSSRPCGNAKGFRL